jgi:hypothetical protein
MWLQASVIPSALILALVLNCAFYPVLWGDRTLMASAAEVPSLFVGGAHRDGGSTPIQRSPDLGAPGWQLEPSVAFNGRELFTHYRLPLWNPYAAYGVPWAAGMLPQPFFPLSILSAAFPSPRSVDCFLLLRLFFAGLFMLLYLRLFLSAAPSLVGAVAFMLTGYFVLFLNIDHLSTEILLPAVFWAFEKMYRSNSIRAAIPSALVIFLSVVSGMPESTFLILVFGYAYFLVRTLTTWRTIPQQIGRLICANVLGFGLAAFLLVPFLEFLHNGLDIHRPSLVGSIPGLVAVSDFRGLLLYLLPFVFGPIGAPTFKAYASLSGLYGYFGIASTVLAGVAVASVFRSRRELRRDWVIILFFSLAAAACLLKHWGVPVINWIGALPLFNMIHYPKYIQPLAGFAVAALAGFGAGRVLSGQHKRECWIVVTMIVACLVWLFGEAIKVPSFLGPHQHAQSVTLPAGVDVVLMFGVLVAGLLFILALTGLLAHSDPRRSALYSVVLVGAVCSELLLNYIYPVYHRFGNLAARDANPFAGTPYVKYLQSRSHDHYRVFARDGTLFPNWSSAFSLSDVRYVYAISYKKYIRFLQAFLGSSRPPGITGELAERFTGLSETPYDFVSPLEQRYLQLSSIRYLVGTTPYVSEKSTLITDILSQNAARIKRDAPMISRSAFSLNGIDRDVLFQHPPSDRLRLTTRVPVDQPNLQISPALSPLVLNGCGDGVTFSVDLENNGTVVGLYSRYIDPKHNVTERRWIDDEIDLTEYAGREIKLLFSTGPGPRGDGGCDWAGWGGMQFVGKAANGSKVAETPLFRRVYRGDAEVFEYAHALPRASIFYGAELASDPEAALTRLRTMSDVWTHAVVTDSDLPEGLRADLKHMQNLSRRRAEPALILSHDSMRVKIATQNKTPGLLVLTDSNYPGWNVYVDGRKALLLDANYLFRGVLVPAGDHTIEFSYEPLSYAYGFGITGVSILGLSLLALKRRAGKYGGRIRDRLRVRAGDNGDGVDARLCTSKDARLPPAECVNEKPELIDGRAGRTSTPVWRRRRKPTSHIADEENT